MTRSTRQATGAIAAVASRPERRAIVTCARYRRRSKGKALAASPSRSALTRRERPGGLSVPTTDSRGETRPADRASARTAMTSAAEAPIRFSASIWPRRPADERKRQITLHAARGRQHAARCRRRRGHEFGRRRVRPQREEHTERRGFWRCLWSRGYPIPASRELDRAKKPRGPRGRRGRSRRECRRSAVGDLQPAFGFSKNCSSSVEFLSAVVDAWLP